MDKEDIDDENLAATYVRKNVDNSSEKHYNDETGEDMCTESSGHVSPNETETAVEPTKRDDVNLNGTETSISKNDQISEFTTDQKPEVNNCQISFRSENTESVRIDNENADSIEGTIREVVTDDSGCNLGDAASNHGSEIPVEVKSQVIDQAGILENKAEEVVSSLPGEDC